MKFDWFLKGMIAAVVLAFVFPEPGAHGGFLHPEVLNKLGIALVFYLNGLSLSMHSLRQGATRWRVHLLIQLSTFLVFPLLGLGLLQLGKAWNKFSTVWSRSMPEVVTITRCCAAACKNCKNAWRHCWGRLATVCSQILRL